ncbi:unnamed protein product [Rotaria sp. Silwood2]|nr:unnamed protein product [Rotaria sp. Silwood2]CAF2847372.1 unnamed protein product [Rotaria sp. Silwood2]CAF3243409.1 unnamed protein product [Rotaria sp. Silwood2]CAF4059151.1 unnamed protein product [Rotaria sp. Silwood2]CAF4305565.1 unnamed protein product [Rotaria sp. Silwood2]
MRVNKELSQNGYQSHHRRKYDDRLKRKNYRHEDHQSRSNGNYSSRTSLKSHHYQQHRHENYTSLRSSSPLLNRKDNDQSNYYDNHPSLSSRFNRQTNSPDIHSPLTIDQPIVSDRPPPAALYYKSSQSMRDRSLSSHYIDSERSRYSPSSSSAYRRDDSHRSPSMSSYRNDHVSRNNNNNDLYIRNEYRSPTSPVLAPLSTRSTVDSYNDIYRQNDYNNRSQHYDIGSNRNGSSRAYHPITSTPSSIHRSDSYRISSTTRMSSPSSLPTLSSSSSSAAAAATASAYMIHDQYTQPFSSMREIDYRTRDYGMTTSIDYHQTLSNKSSDRYDNDYCSSSSSYRGRSNLKRSRSSFDENESKRLMRR